MQADQQRVREVYIFPNNIQKSRPTGLIDGYIYKMALTLYNGVKLQWANENLGKTVRFFLGTVVFEGASELLREWTVPN